MGNRQSMKNESWEADMGRGDYRLKYRSWRRGAPETGPFNVPVSSAPERIRHVSISPTLSSKSSNVQILDSSHFEDWLPARPRVTDNTPLRSASKFERQKSNTDQEDNSPHFISSNDKRLHYSLSLNDTPLDELSSTVTEILVGPEYTPVLSPTNNSATLHDDQTEEEEKASPGPSKPSSGSGMVVNHLFIPVLDRVKEHLRSLPEWYTTRTSPEEVAKHIRALLDARRSGANKVIVTVDQFLDSNQNPVPNTYTVVVCAKDRRQLLDAITRCVSLRASISEATIVTTGDGFAIDRFVLSPRPDEIDLAFFDDLYTFGQSLKRDIEQILDSTPESPSFSPYSLNSMSTHKIKTKKQTSPPLPAQPRSCYEVPFQEIRLLRVLGEGRTGKTYLAERNGDRVAAKVMTMEDNGDKDQTKVNLEEFHRELDLVSRLNHSNIVKFLGTSSRPPRHLLLFELCEGGDLASLVRQKDSKYSFFQIALDAANGLAFLHENNVIHRDIKPENLMLDRSGTVKIADFGLSCYSHSSAKEVTAETGTYRYMAPEVMSHEQYSFPCDVYSYAMVLYVLLSRKLPFEDYTPLQAAMAVVRQDARPKLPSTVPKKVVELIHLSWHKDPSRRPNFYMIIDWLSECRVLLTNRSKKLWDRSFSGKRSASTAMTVAM